MLPRRVPDMVGSAKRQRQRSMRRLLVSLHATLPSNSSGQPQAGGWGYGTGLSRSASWASESSGWTGQQSSSGACRIAVTRCRRAASNRSDLAGHTPRPIGRPEQIGDWSSKSCEPIQWPICSAACNRPARSSYYGNAIALMAEPDDMRTTSGASRTPRHRRSRRIPTRARSSRCCVHSPTGTVAAERGPDRVTLSPSLTPAAGLVRQSSSVPRPDDFNSRRSRVPRNPRCHSPPPAAPAIAGSRSAYGTAHLRRRTVGAHRSMKLEEGVVAPASGGR
jgi:hypothetical protein